MVSRDHFWRGGGPVMRVVRAASVARGRHELWRVNRGEIVVPAGHWDKGRGGGPDEGLCISEDPVEKGIVPGYVKESEMDRVGRRPRRRGSLVSAFSSAHGTCCLFCPRENSPSRSEIG